MDLFDVKQVFPSMQSVASLIRNRVSGCFGRECLQTRFGPELFELFLFPSTSSLEYQGFVQFSISPRATTTNSYAHLMQHLYGANAVAPLSGEVEKGALDVASRAPRDEGRSCRFRPF